MQLSVHGMSLTLTLTKSCSFLFNWANKIFSLTLKTRYLLMWICKINWYEMYDSFIFIWCDLKDCSEWISLQIIYFFWEVSDRKDATSLPKLKIKQSPFPIFFQVLTLKMSYLVDPFAIEFQFLFPILFSFINKWAIKGSFDLIYQVVRLKFPALLLFLSDTQKPFN